MPDRTQSGIIAPYGGPLKDLLAPAAVADELRSRSDAWPVWNTTVKQLRDLELLLSGGFSPLEGFMNRADYNGTCNDMRLAAGMLWPIPITLDVTERFAEGLSVGDRVVLSSQEGVRIAILAVEDLWRADLEHEAGSVFGTTDPRHPGVARLLRETNPVYVGGKVTGLELPQHYDFQRLRHTPSTLRELFRAHSRHNVLAFQTRNPMHRAHVELTRRGMQSTNSHLLIHPVVGKTKDGDVDYALRVKCYSAVVPKYRSEDVTLSLLPLAMRMAGPREAVWHAIIRRNYGCNRFIVGRDHAGPGADASGKPFYGPYEAQELLSEHSDEVGVGMVPFEELVYVADRKTYMPRSEVRNVEAIRTLSGTELRRRLATGAAIPDWFSYPDVLALLRNIYPPRHKQGLTLLFTGLPCSGKSTVANIVRAKLLELGSRPVTLLDGDVVRKNLSSELTFSEEHRNLNIRRLGFVANEISKNGGIAICAPIAPYASIRAEVRELIQSNSGFVEIHVDAPLETCEQRDRKGMYAKARRGLIKGFTGIDAPYERPVNPELRLDTVALSAAECAEAVLDHLREERFLV